MTEMEIVLTAADVAAVNPERLLEELETTLGYEVLLTVHQNSGHLEEARIRRTDGQPFSHGDQAAVYAVAAAHDPEQLSSREQDSLNRRVASDAAKIALDAVDSVELRKLFDGIADPELAYLASVVADLLDYGRG